MEWLLWLHGNRGYHTITEEGINNIFRTLVQLEIDHSEKYLKLYQKATKEGQDEIAKQARDYIYDSIQSLRTVTAECRASGKVTLNLNDKVDEQISKLRAAIGYV